MTDDRAREPSAASDAESRAGSVTEPVAGSTPVDPAAPPVASAASDAAGSVDPAIDRRAFVRRMTGDAAHLAGRLHGVTQMLAVGAAAAGRSVVDNLETLAADGDGPDRPDAGTAGEGTTAMPSGAEVQPPATGTPSGSPAIARAAGPPGAAVPTADQAAALERCVEVVIAVNDAGRSPQLTIAAAHWDGETIRFAGLGWSRRARAVDADPDVTLVVPGDDGRYLTITGRATVLRGDAVDAAMRPLLALDVGDDAAAQDARWAAMLADDADRIVVAVTPMTILTGRR